MRQFFTIAIIAIGCLIVGGCNSDPTEYDSEAVTPLGKVVEGLGREFDIGEKQAAILDFVKAEAGFGVMVDGDQVSLFELRPDSENAVQAKETGTIVMNGWTEAVVYNESLSVILMEHGDHPKRNEIESIFRSIER